MSSARNPPRALRSRSWILATVLAAACLLPTDGGAGFGELRVRPTFDAGADPAATGAEIDSIRTVVRRPGADDAPVVDQVRRYRSADHYTWLIELRASREEFDVELELRSGSSTLYRGGRVVGVENGSLGKDSVDEITVAYLGSTVVDRVEISPARVAFTRIGATRQLDAVVHNAAGGTLPDRTPLWSSDDEAVVSVSATGQVTSTGLGATHVIAAVDGVADTATVVVDTTLAHTTRIDADPDSIPATGSATSVITVEVFDSNGDPVGASAGPVVLASTLGTLGPVTDHEDGTYTATLTAGTTAGAATVSGTLDGAEIADSATVTFTGPGPSTSTSTITADPDSIPADGESTALITAAVRDADNNLVDAESVTLTTTLGTLGPVTHAGTGLYTATLTADTTAGAATVTGTLDGADIADSATVEFTAPGPPSTATSTLTADPDSIPADGESTALITAAVRDADNNLVDAESVTLTTTRGTLGPVTHAGTGLYTATLTADTTAGTATVTGTLDGADIADSATVEFTAPSGEVIEIEHTTVTVPEGDTATNTGSFSALAGGPVTWTASTGSVVGEGGGAWSWSLAAVDGPAQSQVVTITGDDGQVERSIAFDLIVENVAPTVDAGADGTLESGQVLEFTASFSDPGVLDSPWTWLIDWGDGASSTGTATVQDAPIAESHRFCGTGEFTITVSVTDKDGDTGTDHATWTALAEGVRIMIMPADSPNSVSLSRRGLLPVALLSGGDFDATQVDPASLTLTNEMGTGTPLARRPNGSLHANVEDIDGDGLPDLILHFRVPELVANGDLTPETTHLVLRGVMADGCGAIRGKDSVRIVP